MASQLSIQFRQLNRARINKSRELVLNFIILLFDSSKKIVRSVKEDSPILVLRSDGKIGDSIVATGFFRELKRNHPQSKIIVIGSPQVQVIYKNFSYIDEIITYKKGLLTALKIYWKLRGIDFKFFLNSTDELKPHAAFLQGQIRAKEKIVFNLKRLKSTTKIIESAAGEEHFIKFYDRTLEAVTKENLFKLNYEIKIAEETQKKVQNLLPQGKFVAFNAHAGTKNRSLNFESSFKIIQFLLKNTDYSILNLGSPSDLQKNIAWKNKAKSLLTEEELKRWIISNDIRSLDECFTAIKFSEFLISPDTSLVHAACALNTKVLGIYRSHGDYKHGTRWGPIMEDTNRYRVVHSLPNRLKNPEINVLNFDEIYQAIKELI